MNEVTLRAATVGDADRISEIYLSSRKRFLSFVPLIHSDEAVRRWVEQQLIPGGGVSVLEDRGTAGALIGFIALGRRDGCGWIDHLYLAPTALRKGHGTRLVEYARAELGPPLRLYTFDLNLGARRFYERLGFRALDFGDGSRNEEGSPDVLYEWRPAPGI